jgi:hypothetical protein
MHQSDTKCLAMCSLVQCYSKTGNMQQGDSTLVSSISEDSDEEPDSKGTVVK